MTKSRTPKRALCDSFELAGEAIIAVGSVAPGHRQEMLVQRAKPTRSAALAGDYELTYLKAAGADSLARGPLFVMFIDFDLPATVVQKLFAASA